MGIRLLTSVTQKDSSFAGSQQDTPLDLFWAWSAFVFVSANLLTGGVLARFFHPVQAMLALLVGMLLLFLMSAPAVWLAVEKGWNYQSAIRNTIGKNWPCFAIAVVMLVPMVNIGWFAIQTAMVSESIALLFKRPHWSWWLAISLAMAFALGPCLGGFRWLAKAGRIAILALSLLLMLAILEWTSAPQPQSPGSVILNTSINSSQQWWSLGVFSVVGSWVFSSTTCVMDVACYVRKKRPATIAIWLGLLIGDGLLIALGYFLFRSTGIVEIRSLLGGSYSLLAVLFLLLNIWSTNDSNLFSTGRALAVTGWNHKICLLVPAFIGGLLAALWGPHLFDWFGRWLQFMGWMGMGFSLFWWVVWFRRCHVWGDKLHGA